MNRFFIAFLALFVFSFSLVSCKDDDPSVKDQLLGRWNFDRQIVNTFVGGVNSTDTTYGEPGDYVEFRSDNTLVSFLYGSYDSSVYEVLGKDRLVIDQLDTIGIRSVFSNSLVLGNTELSGSQDFYETFIYFFR